jgi:hypothetical protein
MLTQAQDNERLERAALLRRQVAALKAGAPTRTDAELERDEFEESDPDRVLFDALIEAQRREADARRAFDELRARERAIVEGRGDVEGRARQLSATRDELALAELRLSDARRHREMADRRCEAARVRQHARRIEQAQREHAKWERSREDELDQMREFQRRSDEIHHRFLSVEGLTELAMRRSEIEKLTSGRR